MKRFLTILLLTVLVVSALSVPALALTESEVEAQVAANGKEAVAGNVLLWFLCAVAFLKVSQKIDSFLASLGVNVGHTGGSMLAEAMVAMRAVTMGMGGGRGVNAGRTGAASGGAPGKVGSGGVTGFFQGGLAGMVSRGVTNSAVKTATSQTSAFRTAQTQAGQAASTAAAQNNGQANMNSEVHTGGTSIHAENSVQSSVQTGIPPQEGVIVTGSEPSVQSQPSGGDIPAESTPIDSTSPQDTMPPQEGVIITGGDTAIHAPQTENVSQSSSVESCAVTNSSVSSGVSPKGSHTDRSAQTHSAASSTNTRVSHSRVGAPSVPSLGGMVFSHSLQSGGSFANDVIGTVARGEVAGSITGDLAAQSLTSYMGYASPNIGNRETPAYSDVEIGRGRITGVENANGASQGQAFAMYHAEQYTAPSGEYSKVTSADGTQWYKQYAQDAVERKPYKAPDGAVAYDERIVKKLPDPPKRKDRI